MAGKKVKSEVEGIRTELQHLSEAVWALREHLAVQDAIAAASSAPRRSTNAAHPAADMLSDGASPAAARAAAGSGEDFARRVDEARFERGIVAIWGHVHDATGSQAYRWEHEEDAATLLAVDENQVAQLLAAIGHRQRLAILKMVLDRPSSASDLVAALNLGTTGAAYHHLNVLQAADLVTQEERGVYIVQPHRVSAIFAVLAGVSSASERITLDRADAADDEPIDGASPESPNGVVPDGSEGGEKRRKRKAG